MQVCILAVPKFVAFRAGADETAHLQAVGYRVTSDEGEPLQLEGTDDFVTRMQAWALHFTLGADPRDRSSTA
jgi:hypothetical protein